MSTAPPDPTQARLADLTFRHGNAVRRLFEMQGKIRALRGQLPGMELEHLGNAHATISRLTTERSRMKVGLRIIHEQIECVLSADSPSTSSSTRPST